MQFCWSVRLSVTLVICATVQVIETCFAFRVARHSELMSVDARFIIVVLARVVCRVAERRTYDLSTNGQKTWQHLTRISIQLITKTITASLPAQNL